MVLLKWTTGDTITEIAANNRGVRKGTEAEIAAIPLASREDGDVLYNSTAGCLQFQTDATNDKRGNIKIGLGYDAAVVSVTGTTATQVKDISFIKDSDGFKGNIITVIAEIKTSNVGTTAHFRVRLDGSGSDSLDLTTTSATYVIVKGQFSIRTESDGRHTLEFFMDDGAGDTIDNRELEIYGV